MEHALFVEIKDDDGKKVLLNPAKVSALVKEKENEGTTIHLFGVQESIYVDVPIDDVTDVVLRALEFYNQSIMELMIEIVKKEMEKKEKKEVFH